MKLKTWEIRLGIYFLGVALSLYFIDFIAFHGLSYILDNLLLQLAFLPVYIFLSTLIIDQLLARREKEARLRKLYMIIGTFFKEAGMELLEFLIQRDENLQELQNDLRLQADWTKKNFLEARTRLKNYQEHIRAEGEELQDLKNLLIRKKDHLFRMMENPNLLEHEAFAELLWAVFHLLDELEHRSDPRQVVEADRIHLLRDMDRAYRFLIKEWLSYMKHLQEDYPYLYSLAVRTNPFDPEARVEVENEN